MVSSKAPQREIATRLTAARRASRMTKVELAQAMGLSKQAYNPYEQGKITFTVDHIFRFSSILGRSVEYFLGIENGLTPDEDELLARYRALAPELARWLLDSLRGAMGGQHE